MFCRCWDPSDVRVLDQMGNVNDFADITKIYVNDKGIAPDVD